MYVHFGEFLQNLSRWEHLQVLRRFFAHFVKEISRNLQNSITRMGWKPLEKYNKRTSATTIEVVTAAVMKMKDMSSYI